MKYQQVAVDKLIPYANNARTHSDEQVTQIASSIREFGFINPIIIDDKNNVIAGHGRLLASKKLGLKEVPTVLVDHLTDTQRKAYVLADNQLALNAGWDDELLKLELAQLDDVGFDLELLGFDLKALDDVFQNENEDKTDLSDSETKYQIIIKCENEIEQENTYEYLTQKGYSCQVSTY
ncbi:MAG: ParB/Srx family N-terminal domain-containing protein [Bacteroidota bacterium]|jgi:ParB-like chromosome segregation protein Spo0J